MGKNKTGKRGLKIGKISSSHKGICVHTPSGKKIFIDEVRRMMQSSLNGYISFQRRKRSECKSDT